MKSCPQRAERARPFACTHNNIIHTCMKTFHEIGMCVRNWLFVGASYLIVRDICWNKTEIWKFTSLASDVWLKQRNIYNRYSQTIAQAIHGNVPRAYIAKHNLIWIKWIIWVQHCADLIWFGSPRKNYKRIEMKSNATMIVCVLISNGCRCAQVIVFIWHIERLQLIKHFFPSLNANF